MGTSLLNSVTEVNQKLTKGAPAVCLMLVCYIFLKRYRCVNYIWVTELEVFCNMYAKMARYRDSQYICISYLYLLKIYLSTLLLKRVPHGNFTNILISKWFHMTPAVDSRDTLPLLSASRVRVWNTLHTLYKRDIVKDTACIIVIAWLALCDIEHRTQLQGNVCSPYIRYIQTLWLRHIWQMVHYGT